MSKYFIPATQKIIFFSLFFQGGWVQNYFLNFLKNFRLMVVGWEVYSPIQFYTRSLLAKLQFSLTHNPTHLNYAFQASLILCVVLLTFFHRKILRTLIFYYILHINIRVKLDLISSHLSSRPCYQLGCVCDLRIERNVGSVHQNTELIFPQIYYLPFQLEDI